MKNTPNLSMLAAPGRAIIVVAAACLVLGTSGCLLNRVQHVRQQFCDFDTNFELALDDSPEFTFRQPVFLDRDIAWIAGTEPTETRATTRGLSMVYVIEQLTPTGDPGDEYRLELRFVTDADQNRLESVHFDPKFAALINEEFLDPDSIDSAAENFCETRWSFASTDMVVDLSERNLEARPSRLEILDWLGPPLQEYPFENRFRYEFRMKSMATDPTTASIDIWFDEAGEMPIRVTSRYSRFLASTDFLAKTLSVKVHL